MREIMAVATMSWSVSDIAEYMFTEASADGRKKTIRWLQARNLLASQMTCSCGANMNLIQRELQRGTTQDDKWAWKCPECTSVRSIRGGSWFEGTSALCCTYVMYILRAMHACSRADDVSRYIAKSPDQK